MMSNSKYDIGPVRAAVWFGDLPFEEPGDHSEILKEFEVNQKMAIFPQKMAVELNFPAGAIIPYGMIGGYFSPREDNKFVLHIKNNIDSGSFASEIASEKNTICKGIPEEFHNAILRAIADYISANPVCPGDFRVVCGSYSKYGSSNLSFKKVALSAMYILHRDSKIAIVSLINQAMQM